MSTPAAPAVPEPKKLTLTEWLIMVIAAIGFAFDIYELLMLPLVVGPALTEFGIGSETRVISAHRDPHGLEEFVSSRSLSLGKTGVRSSKGVLCAADAGLIPFTVEI